ncbi:hypothetical protein KSP39_PZI013807 [Platanthera zijinensis]|uniref:Uncharacterized protein n=1 Tax=Platanthera zijinensis TaxID=2320716 RepID=A0AAP0BES7_9ASPA
MATRQSTRPAMAGFARPHGECSTRGSAPTAKRDSTRPSTAGFARPRRPCLQHVLLLPGSDFARCCPVPSADRSCRCGKVDDSRRQGVEYHG